jgi:hypothetical protein
MTYLIIRNRRGAKSTWHLAGCGIGEKAARNLEREGWGRVQVERTDNGASFNHRIAKECGVCKPDAHIRHDRFPTMYPKPKEATR